MISLIKDFFIRNKREILLVSVFVFVFVFLSDSAFADTSEPFANKDGTLTGEGQKTLATFLNWINAFATLAVTVLTYLTTMFLSPEWISGNVFGLNEYFKTVWIMVSNFVYLIFAFILIWIAFMNIINNGGEKYQLKKALPRFIIGIFIVPFSRFIVQFILSISAVLTISALSLPYETFETYKAEMNSVKIPNNCTLNLNSSSVSGESDSTETSGETNTTNTEPFYSCTEGEEVAIEDILNESNTSDTIYSTIGIYTSSLLNLKEIARITESDKDIIVTIFDLVVKIVFDFIFIIIYTILIIALALVLMVRGIYIWIYTMLSPVFGLMFFFDKKDGGFFEKFNIKEFIALAMVPVYTILALTFGMLFMFIVSKGMTSDIEENATSGSYQLPGIKLNTDKGTGESKVTVGQFNLTVKGGIGTDTDEETSYIYKMGNGLLGTLGGFILKIFGVVILWGSVMAALGASKITKTVIEPLESFGKQVGQLAAKSPTYLPVFGGQSMASMNQMGNSASSYFSQRETKRGTKFLQEHGLFQQDNAEFSNAVINAKSVVTKQGLGSDNTWKQLQDAVAKSQNTQERAGSKEYIELLKNVASQIEKKATRDKVEAALANAYGSASNLTKAEQMIDELGEVTYGAQSGGHGLLKGVDSTYDAKHDKDYVDKRVGKGATSTTESSGDGSVDKESSVPLIVKPAEEDGKYKIGNNIHIEVNNDALVGQGDVLELAKLIDKGMSKSDFNKLMDDLNITDSKKIKQQLSKYFTDDGVLHRSGNSTKGKIKFSDGFDDGVRQEGLQ